MLAIFEPTSCSAHKHRMRADPNTRSQLQDIMTDPKQPRGEFAERKRDHRHADELRDVE